MKHTHAKSIRHWASNGQTPPSRPPAVLRQMEFFNELPCVIGVAERNGLKYDIASDVNLTRKALVVRMRYNIEGNSRDSLVRLFGSNTVENSPELQLFKEMYIRDNKFNRFGNILFEVEYAFTEQDLSEHGGTAYIKDLDIVLSLKGSEHITYHPYDREAELYRFTDESFATMNNIIGQNFIYSIKIIDNLGQIGKRWLRIGNDVTPIEPIQDARESDGIYVATCKPTLTPNEEPALVTERYGVDDVPPHLKLYKHFHEARHTADDEIALKLAEYQTRVNNVEAALQTSQNNLQAKAHEAENLKQSHELLEKKYQFDTLEYRNKLDAMIMERQRMAEKDKFEALSQDRKNTADLIKTVPAIILGLISIVATAAKLSGGK